MRAERRLNGQGEGKVHRTDKVALVKGSRRGRGLGNAEALGRGGFDVFLISEGVWATAREGLTPIERRGTLKDVGRAILTGS